VYGPSSIPSTTKTKTKHHTMRYHLVPIRIAITKKSKTGNAEDVEKKKTLYIAGGIVN
jgi:hypothetical protein